MNYQIESYPQDKSYHEVFHEVVQFVNLLNEKHEFLYYHWSRWEWMFALDNFSADVLSQIKLFRNEKHEICGMLAFEEVPGVWFAIYDEDFKLKQMMANELINHLKGDVIIPKDQDWVKILEEHGFEKMDWIDPAARFAKPVENIPTCEGYTFKSLEEDYNLDEIHHALWKGFNHGDHVMYNDQIRQERLHMTSSPHFKKRYVWVAIKDGHYVSYAGIWYMKGNKIASIEPVATVPEHRRKGLAGACILHAMNEAKKDGAEEFYVGSTQKFYYDLGFEPYQEGYRYTKKK